MIRGPLALVVSVLMVATGSLAACSVPTANDVVHLPTGFDIEAHRGGRDARPENTLPAFAYALTVGVSTLEMDMQMSADGEIVIAHNAIIPWYMARNDWGRFLVADEQPRISDWSLEDLRGFDLGAMSPNAPYEYWDAHGRTQKQVPGTTVTTLREVFQLTRDWGNDQVFFNLETKSTPYPGQPGNVDPASWVARFLDVVREYDMQDRVMLQSFDWRTLVEMKKLEPSIPTVALTANQPSWNLEGDEGDFQWPDRQEPSPWMAGLDIKDFGGDAVKAAHAIGADVFAPYEGEVTPAVVREAHALGMRVVPYTVDDAERMRELIGMQVDGMITDRPATLRSVCIELGIPVPPADPAPQAKPHYSGSDGL